MAKTRRLTEDKSIFESRCFFRDKPGGNLHRASTLEVDTKVRKYATELNDTSLLTKLAAGDMVAIDAIYQSITLSALLRFIIASGGITVKLMKNKRTLGYTPLLLLNLCCT